MRRNYTNEFAGAVDAYTKDHATLTCCEMYHGKQPVRY